MRRLVILAFLVTIAGTARAQVQPQIRGAGAPTNPCFNGGQQYLDTTNHVLYNCSVPGQNWVNIGLGNLSGGGTVGGALSTATSPNAGPNIIYVSTFCGLQANCFPVNADAKWASDASFTSGSGLVTLSSTLNDPTFSASDVGKVCFGTNFVASTHTDVYTAYVIRIAQGTITSVTDSLHGTCSNNANLSTSGSFVWGTDDTANLNAAWAAASATGQCKSFDIPAGGMIVQGAIGYTTNCHKSGIVSPNDYEYHVQGKGMRNTLLIPTPSFSFANCTGTIGNACFFGAAQGTTISDLSVNGFGNCVTSAPANTAVFGLALDDYWYNLDVDFWGCSDTNLSAYAIPTGQGSLAVNINSNGGGGAAGLTVGAGSAGVSNAFFCCSLNREINTVSGSTLIVSNSGISGNGCGAATVTVAAGAVFDSQQNGFANNCNSGIVTTLDVFGTATLSGNNTFSVLGSGLPNQIFLETTGLVKSSGTTSSAAATSACYAIGGTFIDQGGNTCPVGQMQSIGATLGSGVSGPGNGGNTYGFCSGTATSSVTLGLYGTGPNVVAGTCTSTIIGTGVPTQYGGTLIGLGATATHVGVSASSGVLTVLKNGSPTTLTCTFGTNAFCFDNTHSVAVTRGDLISFQITTQGSEVLAGVKASVEVW